MIQRFLPATVTAALALAVSALAPATAAPVLTQVASGFTQPLAISFSPDGRQFVVEQGGRIVELLGNGSQRNFMTVPKIVVGGEKGLLNLAFPKDFATTRRFYVYCTAADANGRLQVEIRRYLTIAGGTQLGDPASGTKLLTYPKQFENHNGGWMAFGPDGYLYLGTGDGGSGNDPANNAQNLGALLGKILRLDVSGAGGVPPHTNPFYGINKVYWKIFAFGVRNPFRASFDSVTGDLYIGDVGQDTREEVDVIKAGTSGQNLGWRVREGKIQNPAYPGVPTPAGAINPIYDYGHGTNKSAGQGEAITGGLVYHGTIPELQGRYVFADFIDGGLWSIDTNGGSFRDMSALLGNFGQVNPVSFGEDPAHKVYLVDYNGRVFRFDNK